MAQEKSNTHEQEDNQVDLDFDEYEETTVTLASDEDKEKAAQEKSGVEITTKSQENSSEESDEHADVSKSVQKRIANLTKKMREAERRETEAVNYARNVQSESDALKTKLQTVDKGYLTEYGNRLNIEQQQVENDIKNAMDRGDSDAMIKAQRKLTELAVSADRYRNVQRSREQEQQIQQSQPVPQPVPQQPIQQQAPPEQAPDPKAEKWASENNWFGKDEAMTFAAFGIHKAMVENEGFDPQSDDYYDELDGRIRGKFPQEFKNGSGRRLVQNVAGNSRSRSTGRSRKVILTPSQVAIATKLGVPLEEYAKYVKT